MDVTEEIHDIRIRVFKWNEKLFNHKALESHGLFLFRVANKIKKVSYSKGGGVNEVTEFRNQNDVLGFGLDRLLSRDSIEALSRCVVAGTELFFVDTAATLAKLISVYLLLSCQFTAQTLLRRRNPTIVIVVDVYVKRNIDYTKEGVIREVCRLTDEDQENMDIFELGSQDEDQLADDIEVDQEDETEDDSMDMDSDKEEDHLSVLRILKGFLGQPEVEGSNAKRFKQVEYAMMVSNFDGGERPVDGCPICLDGFSSGMVVATTPCSHLFHRNCIFQWLLDTNSCPICRSVCKTLI